MAKYIIHSCARRQWYVEQYLISSMVSQGIAKEDIMLWQDTNNIGNLKMFLSSMQFCAQSKEDGYWHLQDDVILCRDFKKRTEELDSGVVAGFASFYDKDKESKIIFGSVRMEDVWFSMPCIRVPNDIAKEFLRWWDNIAVRDGEVIRVCINLNKNDDWALRLFLTSYYKEDIAINVKPNLVDHIDYILGGSVINEARIEKVRAVWFEDKDLVEDLERKIKNESSEETGRS